MSKTIIAAILGLCVIVGLAIWLNQPEPTPGERLNEAMEDAGDALKDATDAVSDSVKDVSDQVSDGVQNATAEVAETISEQSEAFRNEADRLITAWEETGILTEDGYNHANAVKTIEESSLDGETKDQILTILQQINEAPDQFQQKIAEIKAILEN